MTGLKTWRKQSMEWSQQKTCWWRAWDMVLKEYVSFMTHLFLCMYFTFQFTFMYTIYFISHYSQQCRYTRYTLFLCLYMEVVEEKNNRANQNNIRQDNPSDASGSSTDNSFSKEWWFIFNFDVNASYCNLLYILK